MRSPKPYSTSLETYARFGATLECWAASCGEDFVAIEPLLLPTDRLASSWPGRLPNRPNRRVVRLDELRYRAICDNGLSESLDLCRDQIVLHRVDERKLRSKLCSALGLTPSRDDLRPLPGLLRIGQWRYSQAAGCPVWIACAATPIELADLLRTAGTDGRPFIVMLFTRAAWTADVERIAPADRSLVVTIDDVLDVDDEGWHASEGWDAALGEFVQAARIRVSPGFRAQKNKRVANTGQTAAKLKAALKDWYRSAKSVLIERGELMAAPEIQHIAGMAGVNRSTASRWLNGKYRDRDKELQMLWSSTTNEEYIRRFKG